MTNTPSSSTQVTTPTADSAVSVTESYPSREKRLDNDQLPQAQLGGVTIRHLLDEEDAGSNSHVL